MPVLKHLLLLPLPLAIAACSPPPDAIPDLGGQCDNAQHYDINFTRFDETAQQIAHGTGCFIEADLSELGAIKPNPVKGKLRVREAVRMAIKDTPLKIIDEKPDRIKVGKR
ncbi:hypothetical protein [Idiomarina xiamenensis]|uniref:Putative lipoprotein n=1 Tax=Idiomarina xiamenensis 10-D-4 TaxID=740709 RepID=K2LAR1_9GAMM|nr:hypothetical protein [Idiomarina xiamenensis]EKE86910.1 putative lipoprotein [Idiomarina xiamenensis 10-D-4]